MLAGAMTLAIMVLPTVMRTTEEALICVPLSYRAGEALGLARVSSVRFFTLYFRLQCRAFLLRRDPLDRTYCRRDGGAHLHGRYDDGYGGRDEFGTYAGDPYVCTLQ